LCDEVIGFVGYQGYSGNMNINKNQLRFRVTTLVIVALSFALLPAAQSSEVDPFPGVALGAEIGSRQPVSPSTGNPIDGSPIITCPAGAGLGAVAGGGENYVVCTKTWRPASDIEADATFSQAQRDGQATAEALSLAWNQAHPGQQKCFQWGPVVHANGVSTASGGVCANPVPVPAGYVADSSTVTSDTPTVVSESSTVPVQSESSTPVVTPTPAPARITSGLGGYAVVHPDGHVCGVIVATSTDPFGNGGYMPQEYMGCPSGARIVFQTTPSESGNVAGWHGPNVIYNGSEFVINNGPSSTSINNGVAIESNGRSWDTGTGRVITPGVTDTRTVLSDTTTVVIDTPTVVTETVTAIALAIPVDYMAGDDIDSLPEIVAEEEISNTVEAKVISGKTRIAVVTEWVNTKLSVTATKKGSKKKFTYRFTTNSEGEHTFRAGLNLKGFTLVLYKGTLELDRDFI
jgi:hypothetical protein